LVHPVRIPSQDDVLQVFRKAGFSALSPFQEKLIPYILKGKDVAAQVAPGSGKTVGFVLPLILGLRGAGLAPRAVILASSPDEVGKVARTFARISRFVRDAPAFVPLGEIEDARREQRRLEKGATIVVGTAERVIDHIRRGSLGFDELQTIIVEEPEGDARADFIKDVQFIFAKIADRRQTILFSRSALSEENELLRMLRHPVVLDAAQSTGPSSPAPDTGHLYIPTEGKVRAELLARVILGRRIPSALVYHSPRLDGRRIAEVLQPRGIRVGLLAAGSGSGPGGARAQEDRRKPLGQFARGELDVLLVPLSSGLAAGLEELAPTHVVFFDIPPAGNRQSGGVRKGAMVVALVDRGQEKELARLEEAIGVKINRGEIPGDEEVLTGAIDRMLRRMKTEDPAELTALRTRIRRQVPLLLRPFFMASLLKSLLPPGTGVLAGRTEAAAGAPAPRAAGTPQTGRSPSGQTDSGRAARAGAGAMETARTPRGRFGRNVESASPAGSRMGRSIETQTGSDRQGRQTESQRPSKAGAAVEGQFTQLFISIGRNRRVYARDLTELFTEKLQLQAGDIGGVRVFEKYSFVDIVPGKAGDAIALLSGSELKGRTITVNYAKKKEEKEEK
jgi:ATP-dependent RNA helicase DeaD